MRRFLLILLVLALALMTGVSVLAQEDTSGESTIHVVQAGENVYRISLQYGVTIDAIRVANNLADVNRIYVGQQLTIPAPGTTPTPPPADTGTDQDH